MRNLLESCRIAPPPHTVAEQSLPLIFMDLTWLTFHPVRRLLFYDLPHSYTPRLFETLKESLSITLIHFFPLAGTILYPSNPDKKPEIRYRPGDSVPVTFFESSDDFDDLVGNHAQDADKFYDFMPPSSPETDEASDQKLIQVLAIQVTLFSGRGVCFGFSFHHCAGDAGSLERFIKSWALINQEGFLISNPPVFDRSLIKHPAELDSVFLNQIKKIPAASHAFPLPTNRVRATYVFTQSEIKKLKDLLRKRIPQASSFVVIGAYVWHCLAKSEKVMGDYDDGDDDEPEFFLFAVDARARINPPVPANYFGNCLSFGLAKIEHGELVGEEGFFAAAEAIAEEIKNRVISIESILGGAENRLGEVVRKRVLSVSGSTRFDLCGADFGWGRGRKVEALSIDRDKYAMTLGKSRDCEGGLEVGLSLPKVMMDAFAALFSHGLRGNVGLSCL